MIFLSQKRSAIEQIPDKPADSACNAAEQRLALRTEMYIKSFGDFEGPPILQREYILQITGKIVGPV